MVKEDEEWRKVDFSKVSKLKAVFQKENGNNSFFFFFFLHYINYNIVICRCFMLAVLLSCYRKVTVGYYKFDTNMTLSV